MLCYGRNSIKKTSLYNKVVESLKKSGLYFIEFSGIESNPRLSTVKKGIDICKKNQIDFIVAVRGGSVIDAVEAIAIRVPYEGDIWDFNIRKAVPKKSLPLGVVLTLPGSGSEASLWSVITNNVP